MKENDFKPHMIQWNSTYTNRLWDYYGSSAAHNAKYFGHIAGQHVSFILKKKTNLKKAKTIVDFSSGNGALIQYCVEHLKEGQVISGFDPSEKSIMAANKREINGKIFKGCFQLTSLPSSLADNSVDLVILTEVIEHLTDNELTDILSEIHRILTPEGNFFITTPNEERLETSNTLCPECGCTFHYWQHLRSWNKKTLSSSLVKSGFKVIDINEITWGNRLIDFIYTLVKRKKTGLYAIVEK
jgi:2-polyprenyl-3-methyl-5-hydroxy-6-metoxy-1,4-benzoquinol methylase